MKKPAEPAPAQLPPDLDVKRISHDGEELFVLSFSVPDAERHVLTPAEQNVLARLLEGLTNAEIAALRGTSERTIANQAASIFRKLRVGSRLDLAVPANREKYLTK